jgi:hypothetical protein
VYVTLAMRASIVVCTALLLMSCGDSEGGRDTQSSAGSATAASGISVTATAPGEGSGDATGPGLTTSGADATGDSTPNPTHDDDDDSGGGPKFDVAKDTDSVDPDSGEPVDGCQKIDFLFVVDNSGSMSEEQQSLATSFGGFIGSIQNTVMAKDYHIMVIDTDAGSSFLQECLALCTFFPDCQGYPCDMLPVPEGCDATLGSGLTANPDGDACGIVGDKRYMVDGQPDLAGTFECVAKVGTNGDGSERPMEAMIASVDALNDPAACNDGFLRDDALLVVTYITDEEDDEESNGNPAGWQAALVAAKKGKETSIVVLGLIGDNDQPNAVCSEGLAEASPRLRTFAESFTYGSWASICTLDYAPFFDAAVSFIDTACQQFEPPG